MDARRAAVNLLWAGASVPAWRRCRAAMRDPMREQRRLLEGYLRENEDTAFGRAHRFAAIRSIEEFQATVPLATYDRLEPFITRVAQGEKGVLTRAEVVRLAPSSGSTAAAKLIPWTANLQREFSRAVDAWLADLFLRRPALAGGPAYWSISPRLHVDRPAGVAVPVGFDDDRAYLGGARRALASAVLAVPPEVAAIDGLDSFDYVTLLFLLRARDLRLVSVWHPSFFSRLLDRLGRHWSGLVEDVARGTLTPPAPLPSNVQAALARRLGPDPRRAADLRGAGPEAVASIWPALGLVSCWADGPAQSSADGLARALPGVALQPKGLLATEAVVTIPFGDLHPLAVRSHVFEFLDAGGGPKLLDQLERGHAYAVVVTTGGGLYRYQLGDRVVVDGWCEATPSLRFVGREDRIADWFGEKLSDGFAATAIASLFADRPRPRFAMLAPERTPDGLAYTLFVDSDAPPSADLAAALEHALRRNPHYAWCVELGQLRPARIERVGAGADRAYVDWCVARGQRRGDVKPVSLRPETGWREVLPC
jgi:hypothetical protein